MFFIFFLRLPHRYRDSTSVTSQLPSMYYPYHYSRINIKLATVHESRVVPVHTLNTYMGSRGIAPHILNLGTRWRLVVNFIPWLL